MSQGQTAKPVARAAAELLVIVVGVLIALASDRWLLAQDEAGLEQEYLSRLASDLRRDSATQSLRAEHARATYDRADRLLAAIREGSEVVEDPARLLTEIPWIFLYQYRIDYATETWDELGSTGRLDLLRASEFRRMLGEYHGWIEFYGDIEDWWLNARDQWSQVTRAALPPELLVHSEVQFHLPFIEESNIDGVPGLDVNPERDVATLDSVLTRLRSDPMALPALSEVLMNSVHQVLIYEDLVQRSTGLLHLLDTMNSEAQ